MHANIFEFDLITMKLYKWQLCTELVCVRTTYFTTLHPTLGLFHLSQKSDPGHANIESPAQLPDHFTRENSIINSTIITFKIVKRSLRMFFEFTNAINLL